VCAIIENGPAAALDLVGRNADAAECPPQIERRVLR
jgi:hypothetical protein